VLRETAASQRELDALLARRVAGEPLEHVVGWVEFAGARVAVVPGVFVPRRRTELLVDAAVRRACDGAVVVDLCCGSGAVGVVVADRVDGATLWAVDVDEAAVACARRNVGRRGTVLLGDLYAPLPAALRGRVDLVVVNAPYVPTDEIARMPAEARDHEPRVALDGGPDGLTLHRRVASEAPRWLAPGGHLLIETSERQAAGTVEAMEAAGLHAEVERDDDIGGVVAAGTLPG